MSIDDIVQNSQQGVGWINPDEPELSVGTPGTGPGVYVGPNLPAELYAHYVTGGIFSSVSDFSILMYSNANTYWYFVIGTSAVTGTSTFAAGFVSSGVVMEAENFIRTYTTVLSLLSMDPTAGTNGQSTFTGEVLADSGRILGNMSISGVMTAQSRQFGTVSITPVANSPTSVTVAFLPNGHVAGTQFWCFTSANTTVPGTVVETGYTGVSATGVTIWIYATNTNSRNIDYVVEGQ